LRERGEGGGGVGGQGRGGGKGGEMTQALYAHMNNKTIKKGKKKDLKASKRKCCIQDTKKQNSFELLNSNTVKKINNEAKIGTIFKV
jgi:hypothetical protein